MFSNYPLKEKNIVITGSNGLLGKYITNYCRDAGAIVWEVDYQNTDLNQDFYFDCDLTKYEKINELLEKLNKQKIDAWVNAAYPRTPEWGKAPEESYESWKENLNSQLSLVCYIIEKIGEKMSNSRQGSIVSLASIYGVLAPQFDIYEGTDLTMPAPYSAIKAGLINFSKYMAAKLGPYGIRVNCVSPGGIENNQPKRFIEQYAQKTMLKRMGKPNDVAACVAFLLSDQASYITGQNIMVDGGWSSM